MYTHYWNGVWKPTNRVWSQLLGYADKIIIESKVPIERLYKGDAQVPTIWFNGIDGDAHETFVLMRVVEEFNFCKTSRKPFDIVVTAILTVAASMGLDVSSDGDEEEWEPGVELARKVTGGGKRSMKAPAKVRESEEVS